MSMDEAQIKALYRRHAQAQDATSDDAQNVEDIVATLSRNGWPADEETALDRVAASAMASDIARIVAGLEQDIDALANGVQQVRVPRHRSVRRFMRRSLALAAGVGAFAVLFALLPGPGGAPDTLDESLHDSQVIMAMSFEKTEADRLVQQAPAAEKVIFRGNFDT